MQSQAKSSISPDPVADDDDDERGGSTDAVESGAVLNKRPTTLKSNSETRWSARTNVTTALIAKLPGVIETLEDLVGERRGSWVLNYTQQPIY